MLTLCLSNVRGARAPSYKTLKAIYVYENTSVVRWDGRHAAGGRVG